MYKFTKTALSLSLVFTLILSGCVGSKGEDVSDHDNSDNAVNPEFQRLGMNEETSITLNGDSAEINGYGAEFSGNTLTISQSGTYSLTGLLNGQVLINAEKDDVVRLILNGVTLHNESAPAIYATQSREVIITVQDGTDNTVSDGSEYTVENDDNAIAAIFIQDDLTFDGNGNLTVIGNNKAGIRTQDTLVIKAGTIEVSSVTKAVRGKDGVTVSGGNLTLNAGSDGIYSNEFVLISGGKITINADDDGIKGSNSVTIDGGEINILDCYEGIEGLTVTINGGIININARDDGINASDPDSVSSHGGMGGRFPQFGEGGFPQFGEDGFPQFGESGFPQFGEGGFPQFDEDGFPQFGEGGFPQFGEDGFPQFGEGGFPQFDEDGFPQFGEGGFPQFGEDGFPQFGEGGEIKFEANDNCFVRITGGEINIYAVNDGIDSNGHIYMEGGTLKISAPSMLMNGAIDLDGTFTLTGGEIITAGSSYSTDAETSTQPMLLVSYAEEQTLGSVITVKDSEGNILLEYESETAYSMSAFTSPSFEVGETYSLYIDGEKRTDIKLDSLITKIGDNGGAYSEMGMFGGGGRMPSGGRNPNGDWGGRQPRNAD